MADKSVQLNLYKAIQPLLMAAGNRPLIVITPFPRYISSPCCHNENHVTNFREANYVDTILAQLAEVARISRASSSETGSAGQT